MTDRMAQIWHEALSTVYTEMPNPPEELINGIIIRSLIIDYAVLGFLSEHGVASVCDLGCGFSTRYHRIKPRVEAWMHVDLPEVMRKRCSLYQMNVQEIPVGRDFRNIAPQDVPISPTFASAYDHLYIAEGLLNHLERLDAERLIQLLCNRTPGGTLVGTVMMSHAIERLEDAKTLAELGLDAPMWGISSLYPMEKFLKPARLERVWFLGKIATRLGFARAKNQEEASGVVFRATL